MPYPKGKKRPEGAGRRKGTPNRKTQSLLEKCEELECDPFEILLRFAKNDWKGLGYESAQNLKAVNDGEHIYEDVISAELRATCAKEASQYLYPKRKAIELSGDVDFALLEQVEALKDLPNADLIAIARQEMKRLKLANEES